MLRFLLIFTLVSSSSYATGGRRGLVGVGRQAHDVQSRAARANRASGSGLIIAGVIMLMLGKVTGRSGMIYGGLALVGMGMQARQTATAMETASGLSRQSAEASSEAEFAKKIETFQGRVAQDELRGIDNLGRAKGIKGAEDALRMLKAQGYKLDEAKGTITTPSGEVLGKDDFKTSSLKKRGVSAEVLETVQSKLDRISQQASAEFEKTLEKDAKSRQENLATASGSSYPKAPTGFSSSDIPKPVAAQERTSGLTKQFGDSRIGVPADNIFNLVQDRYKELLEKNFFIPEPKPSSETKAP